MTTSTPYWDSIQAVDPLTTSIVVNFPEKMNRTPKKRDVHDRIGTCVFHWTKTANELNKVKNNSKKKK